MANVVLIIAVVVGLLMTVLSHVAVWLGRELWNRGKKRIVWMDDDERALGVALVRTGGKVKGVRLAENEFVIGKGDTGQVFRLEGRASYSGKYPTWVLHKRHGWNLVGPTDSETIHKDTYGAALSIFDPAAYYKAVSRNEAADTLSANEDKDKWGWVLPVALVGVGGIVIALGMLGWIISKMGGAGGGGA